MNSWWLRSLSLYKQANLKEAVDLIRENIDMPSLPEMQKNAMSSKWHLRELTGVTNQIERAVTLSYVYLEQGDYGKALPIIEKLLDGDNPAPNLYYWRGECLYRLQDYGESWYAFEYYIEVLRRPS